MPNLSLNRTARRRRLRAVRSRPVSFLRYTARFQRRGNFDLPIFDALVQA